MNPTMYIKMFLIKFDKEKKDMLTKQKGVQKVMACFI